MSIPAAPFQVLADENHGPLVTLVSVAFLIATIIFVAAKFVSAIYFKQQQTIVNTPIWIGLVGTSVSRNRRVVYILTGVLSARY